MAGRAYRYVSRILAAALLLCLAGVLLACQGTATGPPVARITVQLAWTHSAQFAGYYAAEQNGYYAAEGLDVTFKEGGGTVDRFAAVLDGSAQFGIASSWNLIEGRVAGKPVRAIAAILRRDPFVFFSLADSGITRPEDFVGKTIQVRPRARAVLYAIAARVGVRPDQFTEDADATVSALFAGKVDVASGLATTEVLAATNAGYRLNVIYPDDYGAHFTSDLIFAKDDFLAANHDLTLRFLRATLKGWTYAVENESRVGSLVLKYRPSADPGFEDASMIASIPFINTGEDSIGWMKAEVWTGMEQTLREQGVLTAPLDVTQLYTMQFLDEIKAQ